MSQKFQAAIQHRGDVSYVKLAGVIDEDNELSELVEQLPSGTAVIDLGEIERINSCGVRDWVNWLGRLEQRGSHAVLVECSPAIVAQINLVNNFTGSGVVKSFYVPYFCPECDEEKVLLVESQDMGPPPHEPPTCRCDECDLVMDFDDMPDSYFAFLSSQKKLSDHSLDGAVRELAVSNGSGAQNRVKSRSSVPNMPAGTRPSVPSLRASATGSTTNGVPTNGVAAAPTGRSFAPDASGRMKQATVQPPSRGSNVGLAPQFASIAAGGMTSSGAHPSMTTPGQPMAFQASSPMFAAAPPKRNGLVFLLIAVLLALIGVLGYLVLAK